MAVREENEAVALADLVLEAFDSRLPKLDHPPTFVADQVIVVVTRPHPFVAVALLANPHAADDSRIDQQVERSIDGRPEIFLAGPKANQ
jgi:hypothetical protein